MVLPERLKKLSSRLRLRLAGLYLTLKHARLTSPPNRLKGRLSKVFQDSRYFSVEKYLEQNPDVISAGLDAYEHFLTFGLAEGREGLFFDAQWYLRTHPDVAAMGIDGELHYRLYGQAESRSVRYISVKHDVTTDMAQSYGHWIKTYDSYTTEDEAAIRRHIKDMPHKPLISVILPVYRVPLVFLQKAIESVLTQSYPHLELCICDDASGQPELISLLESYQSDPRVKLVLRHENGHISEASNSALGLAKGEFVALLDHDDMLAPNALFWVAEAINRRPDADIFYSDEDKIDEKGNRYGPYFKCDFNYELFLAQNMLCHLSVFRRSVLEQIGGFRTGYEGAQDHDLSLRALEATGPERICHIPRVLYHWRAIQGSTALAIGEKNYATQAGLKAVTDHISRLNIAANVSIADERIGHYRVRYGLPKKADKVSIIIPTRDQVRLLKICINSILQKTSYPNFEIIVIDNGSIETETLDYFVSLDHKNITIVRDDSPFNYSKLNNLGVKHATGKYICLMNNDIEIVTPDWLEEMVSFAQRPDVGCVGARLWYPDMTIQHAGVILGIGGVAGHAHKHISARDPGYFCRAIHHQALSAVTGACLLVRSTTYKKLDGLDEAIAVAFNDVDFCLRVRELGLRNVWTPYAQMIHHESASRGSESTPEKQARFAKEVHFMLDRWGEILDKDPFYSPNLGLDGEDFPLAHPPRVPPLSEIGGWMTRTETISAASATHAQVS